MNKEMVILVAFCFCVLIGTEKKIVKRIDSLIEKAVKIHLLTHTSGIHEILRNYVVVKESLKPRNKGKALSYFINKPSDFDPGTQCSYSNSGCILLGLIVERVTGQTCQGIVRKFILIPLEIKRTDFYFTGLNRRINKIIITDDGLNTEKAIKSSGAAIDISGKGAISYPARGPFCRQIRSVCISIPSKPK